MTGVSASLAQVMRSSSFNPSNTTHLHEKPHAQKGATQEHAAAALLARIDGPSKPGLLILQPPNPSPTRVAEMCVIVPRNGVVGVDGKATRLH
jgi:hypothetical protein